MPRSWLLAALLLVAGGAPAWAHAILLESAPAANATLRPGHAELRLRFNSRIDAARSRLSLGPPGQPGAPVALAASDRPDVLAGPAELAPGRYVLHWQVLAVDGHITRGSVAFTVADGG